MARIEAGVNARLGVAILDSATGLRRSYRGEERFPMCSTVKALACGAVLKRVDAGEEDLDRRIHYQASDVVPHSPATQGRAGAVGMTMGELCEAAMTLSDNTALNLIVRSLGGFSAVTLLTGSLGDTVTRLDRWEIELSEAIPGDPRDTTTPDAMAADMLALAAGNTLSGSSRDRFVAWLEASTTGHAKLRAGLPENWRVGDKTGSGGYGTTNDVAVIWPPGRAPLIVAAFLTETTRPAAEANSAFVDIARWITADTGP